MNRQEQIQKVVVTAEQMREIEGRVFDAGMPVAALMEKVAGLIARRIQELYPVEQSRRAGERETGRRGEIFSSPITNHQSPITNHPFPNVGILVGPGHNGGDALVVARELYFCGYGVKIYCPFQKLKELTSQHAQYAKSLVIPFETEIARLEDCDLIIDGLFGFGLERAIADPISTAINHINQLSKPIISIDLPSGLHTDTGEVLGVAIRATHTLCLGLWKLGLLQDPALEYVGKAELIDFDIPLADISAVLGETPQIQRVTPAFIREHLPLTRPAVTHKYRMGHLLLVCGSRRYAGGAILTALGARASGVGMLSVALPESLKTLLVAQLPEALIIGCPETESGAISHLPDGTELSEFSAIACGPGLTKDATPVVQAVLDSQVPLILDADGLNILAQLGTIPTLLTRQATTILTPHTGEFKRLFPDIVDTFTPSSTKGEADALTPNPSPRKGEADTLTPNPSPRKGEGSKKNRVDEVQQASQQTGAVVLLKGARTIVAHPSGVVWIVPESTPALARGGSGDVLTGLMGGLAAQAVSRELPVETMVQTAAWWHAQAGILAAQERTELGVDAFTLTQYLIRAIAGSGICADR